MSRSPLHPIPLLSEGYQDTPAPLPPLLPPLQNPSSRSWASRVCGPSTWGLSCLLALQHFLVLASLLWASHLLLLHGLPPGGLSYPPAQLLASSFFSCGLSTVLQTWMGSRLPLIQAPSLEFLIPALVLTNQKLPLTTKTPGNASLSLPLCSLTRSCHGLELWNTSLREVSGAVVVSGLLQGTIGLLGVPGRVFPYCGPLVLAPSLVVAGLSAHKEVAQFCSAHWGLALLTWVHARYPFAPGGHLQLQLTFVFPSSDSFRNCLSPRMHLGFGCHTQTGSRRVAHLVGLFCMGLGLSPRLAQLFTSIPLPVLGGVLGVTQAVVLSAGFSSFHLADIDSGRNVFIVGFSIFMALLLPRWLREAPVLLNTGWSPLDMFLRSLLAEPIFLAGLLGFLLENTISGTRAERGLGQRLPTSFTAQEIQMLQQSRRKAAQEYGLPLPIRNLCSCIPQPLHCLCPMPEDSGDEGGSSKTGERADLLPNSGESYSTASREGVRSQ
ncbi:solute carrier family 23 member 3 isoform X5 [Mus musculus]|uniref:solute carrier family 23 member 3 isoform X5 n=1 Tax=Mus musculus TaxID=10090 RepID=UPI0011AE27A2|nr:solute carrier family 23 member 3 isoform X5 [Mus musculus]